MTHSNIIDIFCLVSVANTLELLQSCIKPLICCCCEIKKMLYNVLFVFRWVALVKSHLDRDMHWWECACEWCHFIAEVLKAEGFCTNLLWPGDIIWFQSSLSVLIEAVVLVCGTKPLPHYYWVRQQAIVSISVVNVFLRRTSLCCYHSGFQLEGNCCTELSRHYGVHISETDEWSFIHLPYMGLFMPK